MDEDFIQDNLNIMDNDHLIEKISDKFKKMVYRFFDPLIGEDHFSFIFKFIFFTIEIFQTISLFLQPEVIIFF